jgi:hypothetical protein
VVDENSAAALESETVINRFGVLGISSIIEKRDQLPEVIGLSAN